MANRFSFVATKFHLLNMTLNFFVISNCPATTYHIYQWYLVQFEKLQYQLAPSSQIALCHQRFHVDLRMFRWSNNWTSLAYTCRRIWHLDKPKMRNKLQLIHFRRVCGMHFSTLLCPFAVIFKLCTTNACTWCSCKLADGWKYGEVARYGAVLR